MLQCNVICGWFCRFAKGANGGADGFSLSKRHENLIALTLLRRAIYFSRCCIYSTLGGMRAMKKNGLEYVQAEFGFETDAGPYSREMV